MSRQAVGNFSLLKWIFELYFKCKTTFQYREAMRHLMAILLIYAQERTSRPA